MEIVNIEAGTFKEMITSIRLLKEKLENLKNRQTSKSLDDWMDNQEVCMALNISQRTLQALRSNGTLPFSQIDRKTYYRRQDVIRLIEKGKKRSSRQKRGQSIQANNSSLCKRLYLTVRCEV